MRQLYNCSPTALKHHTKAAWSRNIPQFTRISQKNLFVLPVVMMIALASIVPSQSFAQITLIEFDDRSGADNQEVEDNSVAGKWLGLIDVTGGTAPYTFELVEGDGDTNNGLFYFVGDSLFAADLIDLETLSTPLSFRIQATDAAATPNVFAQAIGLGITDVDESTVQFGAPSDEFQVNPLDANSQTNVAIAQNTSGAYVIVWQDQIDGIEARRFSAAGALLDEDPLRIDTQTNSSQIDPDVAMADDGSFVVVWQGKSTTQTSDNNIRASLYDATGTPGTEFIVNTQVADEQTNPQVAMNAAGSFVVTWEGISTDDTDGGIYARRYQADGTAIDADQLTVNTTFAGVQSDPTVGIGDNGAFAVAWTSVTATAEDIIYRFYDATGTPGAETTANNETTGSQTLPSLSMRDNSAFVITWQGEGTGDTDGIYARRFDNTGGTVGAQFAVNSTTAGSQVSPSLAFANDGTFVITYTGPGSGNEVLARRFNDNLTANGNSFEVNRFRLNPQRSSDIAIDNNGGFVVAWESDPENDGNYDIYARRYYANDAPTAVALDDNTIEDASALGTAVGTLSTEDPDGIGPFGYALVDVANNPDNAAFAIDGNQLVTAAAIDQATQATYSVRVRSTDGFGLFVENVLTINVGEAGANTDPVLAANTGLNVAQGDTVVVQTAALQVTDTESAADAITYTLVQAPVNGSLQKNETALAATETFTQADIDGGLIIYVHTNSDTTPDSLTFTAADADGAMIAETQVNITITAPGIPIASAGSDQIVTDEDNDGSAEVTLDGTASTDNGTIDSYAWIENDTDTLATVANPTITLAVGVHTIALVVTDNEMNTASDTIVVTVSAPDGGENTAPTLATNEVLTVDQGDTVVITNTELQVTDTESAAEAITYTLTQVPANGSLQLNGADVAASGTFTQKDIDDGLIRYANDDMGQTADSIKFTVADADGGTVEETTFQITINASPVTGIGDEINGKIVVIYPNPSQESLYIKMENSFRDVQVDVSNSVGKLIKSLHLDAQTLRETPIDIQNLSKGTYFVRIKANNQTVIRKLIKE